MTTTPNNFLTLLRDMTDDQLSSALAMDTELIKKAHKALAEAKQKKIDMDNAKNLQLLASTGLLFDEKHWARLKRLVTGPYNEANALEFKASISKTDINTTPNGEMSLMQISLDYLSQRNRVLIDWPLAVFNAGARFAYPEIKSLIQLVNIRAGLQCLGNPSRGLFSQVFSLHQPWDQHEKQLILDGTLKCGLIKFYQDIIFKNSSVSTLPTEWLALETMARAGCDALPIGLNHNTYKPGHPWEDLLSQSTSDSAVADAKLSAFKVLIHLGWCDVGLTALSDSLKSPGGGNNSISNCGSRSSLLRVPLDNTALDLFECLCERESKIGFERYDSVGRSRFYFANERMSRGNLQPSELKVLLSLAQRCLELGDSPESVNSQNPIAKAAHSDFRQLISVAMERRELGSTVLGSHAPRTKIRSL